MINIIDKYIKRHQLFGLCDKLIVGVSGGADSVAMLHVLLKLGYTCEVAHCNFHLRGEESNRDEVFVKQLAKKFHLPFHKIDFDTKIFAEEKRISIEMAARELRYAWFEKMRQERDAQYITVAHNADDVVETALMNLTRGTSIDGLRGIEPKNGTVVRPFLELWRADIEQYLQLNALQYVEDSTNAEEIYLRNKFRHSVIPLLETINPAFKKSALRTISHLKDIAEIYHENVKNEQKNFVTETKNGWQISIPELKERKGYNSLLYEFLKEKDFNPTQVDDILNGLEGESGQQYFSKKYRVLKDRDFLFITFLKDEKTQSYLIEEAKTEINEPIRLKIEILEKPANLKTLSDLKDKNTAWLDAEKLQFPLQLRRWQEGDFFYPFGMRRRKKLSDYFIDQKFSLFEKENAWLLLSGRNIVWLVGERIDERYKIDENTRKILKIKYSLND